MEIFNKNFGIILAILLFGTVISLFSIQYSIQQEIKSSLEIQKAYETTLKEIIQERVLYLINKGDREILEYKVIPSADSTVFSLLEKLAQRENFELSYKLYPEMGVFIESIDGFKNGRNNKYWQYWVNDKLPMVAADRVGVKGGDKVEWKFAPVSF